MGATIHLQREPFDAAAETAALTRSRTDIGAVVAFTGICRGAEDGAPIAARMIFGFSNACAYSSPRSASQAIRSPTVAMPAGSSTSSCGLPTRSRTHAK